jgi:hypothetical protein
MKTYIMRAEAVLKQLDEFLLQFSCMISKQQSINAQQSPDSASAALLKQMLHAQAVVEDRRRDLLASLNGRSADRFVHELWALAGDMAHFDFDINHLTGFDAFLRFREDISLEAMNLTKDLSDAANMIAFVTELVSQRGS